MIKKIGILTSGGDAPGMNAAVRAVVKTAINSGVEVYGILDGYRGILENRIIKMEKSDVAGIQSRGGTILGTVRYPEFKNAEVREATAAKLKELGIEALVCIGGDGTYMGAMRLTELGINCIGIPGTIDNDISSTDYTLGFDTAMSTIAYCIDHLRDTSSSHHRCTVVEVMGNHCGDLAMFSAVGLAAEIVVTPQHMMSVDQIIDKLNSFRGQGRKQTTVLVSEKMAEMNVVDLAAEIDKRTKYEAKWEILGRIQRGGAPSAFDRLLGATLGGYATQLLLKGKGGLAVGIHNNQLVANPIYEALKMHKEPYFNINEMLDLLNN
jgi:6-phosphofructokinase 1